MTIRFRIAALPGIALAALAAPSLLAGPIWCEPDMADAGDFPGDASASKGTGPNFFIMGELKGPPAPLARGIAGIEGDFRDMYMIRIVNPNQFRVSTAGSVDPLAGAEFDSQLFLFSADGRGVLASLNDPNDPAGGATIRQFSNDGSMQDIPGPGLYFLAISGANPLGPNNIPLNADADRIFAFDDPFEVSGPDGAPGGPIELAQWAAPGQFGEYQIALQGVSFAENPCLGDCDVNGVVDFADLVCALFEFGSPQVEADCDVNGVVDFNDLVCMLFRFGQCDDGTT